MENKPVPHSQEIELKLALPAANRQALTRQLKKVPALANLKPRRQRLVNIYFDTPEQALRQQQIALRVRQIASTHGPAWLQTLKTHGGGDSALSQRGEWEVAIGSGELSLAALDDTPWRDIDPDGTLFRALAPCFTTRFDRTNWQVQGPTGSIVTVSLDIGEIEAGEHQAPICELELELVAGDPAALFDLAQEIAQTVAVLPASQSKSERGHALALGTLEMPQRPRPPALSPRQPAVTASALVLREMFSQFTRNLNLVLHTDNPEAVHQARIGWRRFKSGLRFFGPLLIAVRIPDLAPLQNLLRPLGQLRDLDMAITATLPSIAIAYRAADPARELIWRSLERTLIDAANSQRAHVCNALREPRVGATLLAIARFIEAMSGLGEDELGRGSNSDALRPWAERRTEKLREKLKLALQNCTDVDARHRARILAKRLRYSVEAMEMILPKRRARRWLKRATEIQTEIGACRDFQRACRLAREHGADACLLEFLRGYGLGAEQGNDRLRQ